MPQGTLLGVILYILYIIPVGFPGEVTINCKDHIHNYLETFDNIPVVVQSSETLPDTLQSVKFMDDANIQHAVDLRTELSTIDDALVLKKETLLSSFS